jgi:hypothetical protein
MKKIGAPFEGDAEILALGAPDRFELQRRDARLEAPWRLEKRD